MSSVTLLSRRKFGEGILSLSGFLAAIFIPGIALAANDSGSAIALVLRAENARIQRSGRLTPDRAQPGSVIFLGDAIISEGGQTSVADCTSSTLLDFSGVAKVTVSTKGLEFGGAVSPRTTSLTICQLPQLDANYQAGDLEDPAPQQLDASPAGIIESLRNLPSGTLPDQLNQARAILSYGPDDLIAQIASASLLEQLKLTEQSLALYRHIRDNWPGATWATQPIQRLLLAKTIAVEDSAGPTSATAASDPTRRKTYAFLIGISHYEHQDWVQDLNYADQDAILFQQFLMSPRGGSLVPGQDLTMLLNGDATQENIRKELKDFVRGKGSRENTLIIFVAAHGRYVCIDKGLNAQVRKDCKPGDSVETPYILTSDSSPEDPKTLGLAMDEFRTFIIDNAATFGRVLVYVDVCHAGNIGRLELPTTSAIQQQLSGNGTGLLMATTVRSAKDRDAEFAYESPTLGHGVFTYWVVRELNGTDATLTPRDDNYIHFQDLVARVTNDVPPVTDYRQFPMAAIPIPQELPVVEDPSKPGIVPWNDVGDKTQKYSLRRRGTKGKKGQSSAGPPSPSPAGITDQAQRVIVTYVQGEQVPQKQEDFDRAAALFRQAWQQSPDRAFTESRMLFCEARSLLFRQAGQDRIPADVLERARTLLERSILLDPTRAYAYNALGIAYLEAQENDPTLQTAAYDRAISAFTDANRFAPYWAYPLHNMALVYEQKGDYDEAIAMYREAMRVAPWASYPAYNLGLLLQKLNRIDDARQEFLRAIEVALVPVKSDPRTTYRWSRLSDGYNALAALEANMRRWRQAKGYLNEALRLDPTNPLVLHNQALLDAGVGRRSDRAIQTWRNLLQTDSKNPTYRSSLARTLASAQKSSEAVTEYKRLLADWPTLTGAWRELALIYVRSGEIDQAVTLIESGLNSNPTNHDLAQDAQEIDRIRANGKPATKEYREAWSEGRKHLQGRR